MEPGPSKGPDRLDSWKAISAYLNRDERTVRRWERERGLPIGRVPGGHGSSVFAYRSELDAWLRSDTVNWPDAADARVERSPVESPSRPSRSMLAGAGAVALAAAVVAVTAWREHTTPLPAGDVRLQITPAGVVALDPTGAALWRHPFSPAYITALSEVSEQSHVLAGPHPAAYVTTAHRVRLADGVTESGELLEIGLSDGKPLRAFSFDDHVMFDSTTYDPPWAITAFAVDDSRAPRRLAVASHHFEWSASLLTVLDEQFRRHGTYVQSGWIEAVHWMAPNRLMIGGFNHARDGGMLALLDPEALGQAPEAPGSHDYCETCGTSAPLRMVMMPRTEVNCLTRSRFNRARV
ncbi:MAG: helix-turn-helix domain-containing protein, partial [Acidobacteria bacterium]|nr:helix-turn-helix domain-containing protein [Acidobacteriota bacterium]